MAEALPVVIVGAGMAAYGVAREFRKLDKTTPLLIVSSDQAGAYSKPMLSNALAMGKGAAQLQSQSAGQMAATLDARILAGVEVTAIDTAARTITGADGQTIAYRDLVLALGARPIRLPLQGNAAEQVLSVNHLDDYAVLRERIAALGRPAHVALLGAGLIGCEFADDLVAGGHQVTLVDPNPRPLAALAAPGLSEALVQAWASLPITLKMNTTASTVEQAADGAGLRVTLADGSVVEADIVLSAVGLRPSIALAQAAQLKTGRAIGATLAGTPTPIALKPDAVVVKTPSLKLALAPPPAGSQGEWTHIDDGERVVARFVDLDGIMRGFGLSLHTPALRSALLAELEQAGAKQ